MKVKTVFTTVLIFLLITKLGVDRVRADRVNTSIQKNSIPVRLGN